MSLWVPGVIQRTCPDVPASRFTRLLAAAITSLRLWRDMYVTGSLDKRRGDRRHDLGKIRGTGGNVNALFLLMLIFDILPKADLPEEQ